MIFSTTKIEIYLYYFSSRGKLAANYSKTSSSFNNLVMSTLH